MVIFSLMPFLMFLFAVTMGINHKKAENYDKNDEKDDDERLVPPYFADKSGRIVIHTNLLKMKRPLG